jgi:DNA polymerase-3 subunit delta'
MNPTSFTQVIGNSEIKHCLEKMLEKKAIANSILLAGPAGVGKSQFAHVLASKLICENDPDGLHIAKMQKGIHPDLHVYHPEGKLGLHTIQSLRQLGEEVHLPPYEAAWKVFIIHDAERMLSFSANALLKTFEEPPPHTLIILLSRSPASILPTIISRCRLLQFHTLAQKEIEDFLEFRYKLEPDVLKITAELAHGSIGRAVHLAENKSGAQRSHLLDTMAKGPIGNYKELSAVAATIAEQVEMTKKNIEEAAKEEFNKTSMEYLTAQQQQSLEKELEGVSAVAFVNESQALFEQILTWYRDLEVLKLGGSRELLINKDYAAALLQSVQKGRLVPLERVQKAIGEAQLALQRSTSLNICLENLFLKLGWL